MAAVDMSEYEKLGCLHEMFVKQARETPTKTAVVSENGKKMTFGQLDEITDILANHLRTLGMGKNKVAGIFMERSVEYTISYIAILKSGGAYFPIEMSYPASLIKSVLEDAKPVAICTKNCYVDLLNTDIRTVNLDGNWVEEVRKQKYSELEAAETVSLDDMAYTVYSSGTTGKPKGIQCPHRGSVFSYTWRHRAYPYDDDEREACNVFFVWEMLRPLLKGIPMYIIPDTVIYDPSKLLEFLQKNQITRMLFTPSLIQAVLDARLANMLESFASMRQMWLCGEVVTTNLRNRIASTFPWIKILNLYSISECHDVSCSDLTDGTGLQGRTYCPVGKIFPLVEVAVFDENYNEKLTGEAGEIYVGGPTLAIGYLNRPDLNKERFKTIEYSNGTKTTKRWYKTGDWGYVLSDGSLEIVGRCDSMVKIRGYTIEMKAVENALLQLQEVDVACVLTVGSEGSDKILVAYVILNEKFVDRIKYLRVELKKLLPFYMIPSQFIPIDKIPILDLSGKINVNQLPPIRSFDENNIVMNDSMMDQTTKTIAKVWSKILKIDSIESDDNFFDLGGHSLQAAVTVSRINELLKTELLTSDLYANPTIELLSRRIKFGHNDEANAIDLNEELKKYSTHKISTTDLRRFWMSVRMSKDKFQRGNILLTGATGFLGSSILERLMNDTQATVYCLVRKTSTEDATERLHNLLKSKSLSAEFLHSRVIPIPGDVSLRQFGLENIEYEVLEYDIDAVIHCAAKVNLALPYSALHRANIIGTHNVVSFCSHKKLKSLHFISTNDVFPRDVEVCSENEDMKAHVDKLDSGYAQTKWMAEQIVISASQNGLPTIITRCGNIGGSQISFNWNKDDMTLLLLQGVILSQAAPDIPWHIELTPVNFVSDIIVRLTKNLDKTYGKVYHLINHYTIDCRDFWRLLQKGGYQIELMSYEKWIEKVTLTSKNLKQLESLTELLNAKLKTSDYLTKSSTYVQKNLNEFLVQNGVMYPRLTLLLLGKYVENFVTNGFIPPPPKIEHIVSENKKLPLTNKIALVTGASTGIGNAIAETLARAGIMTVGAARNFEKLLCLRDKLAKDNIRNFFPIQMDVTNKMQVFSAVAKITASVGHVDILVNNAGIMEYGKMINCDLDQWLQMINVNCIGFLNVTAAILPHMKSLGAGHIVNITSDAGKKAFSGLAVYSGTKFFQEVVSEAMRQEIASHSIKVSCVAPGDVATGLHEKSFDKEALREYNLKIKYLDANEIATTVLFLLNQSPNCSINSVLIEPIMGPI